MERYKKMGLRFRTTKVHYKPKPRPAKSSTSRYGPVTTRTTASSKKAGFTSRLKQYARNVGEIAHFGAPLLGGFLSGMVRNLPDMIANAIPSLSTVLGQPKLLLGVGLCLFVAYEALKI